MLIFQNSDLLSVEVGLVLMRKKAVSSCRTIRLKANYCANFRHKLMDFDIRS